MTSKQSRTYYIHCFQSLMITQKYPIAIITSCVKSFYLNIFVAIQIDYQDF